VIRVIIKKNPKSSTLECFKIQCFNDTCGCQPGSSPCNPLGKCTENPGGTPICTCTFNLNIDPSTNCQKCKDKYWGFPDCRTCDYCLNGLCSLTNGSCLCNPHFIGSSCDSCDINWNGDKCDKEVITNNHAFVVIIIVVIVLVAIAATAGAIYYYKFIKNSGFAFKKLTNWNTKDDDDIIEEKDSRRTIVDEKDEKDVKEDQKALLVDNEDKSNFEKSSSEKSTIQVKKN